MNKLRVVIVADLPSWEECDPDEVFGPERAPSHIAEAIATWASCLQDPDGDGRAFANVHVYCDHTDVAPDIAEGHCDPTHIDLERS